MTKYLLRGYRIRIDPQFTDVSLLGDDKNIGIIKEKRLNTFCGTKEEIIKAVEEYFKEE